MVGNCRPYGIGGVPTGYLGSRPQPTRGHLLCPSTSLVSPNYGKIIYYEKAYPEDGTIQLVTNQNDLNTAARVGRATYMNPMHLWDKASRNFPNFTTYFSFTINSQGSTTYGDGLTFFLVPAGSRLPINPRKGGSLALTNQPLNSTCNQFVAVDFEIFQL
ncbi:hypothetical protein RJ639_002188 [Escallonia herrerae]|uniref:Legume lectin domain-containing protein n=1 Tax=Escallonia herrerae TaxID=1293975 RepID=A0AA88X962_9ASTE|nr:hypothetical protein RJ639_002188 [Escallonia herrerae]